MLFHLAIYSRKTKDMRQWTLKFNTGDSTISPCCQEHCWLFKNKELKIFSLKRHQIYRPRAKYTRSSCLASWLSIVSGRCRLGKVNKPKHRMKTTSLLHSNSRTAKNFLNSSLAAEGVGTCQRRMLRRCFKKFRSFFLKKGFVSGVNTHQKPRYFLYHSSKSNFEKRVREAIKISTEEAVCLGSKMSISENRKKPWIVTCIAFGCA